MSALSDCIFGYWVHSREEDTGDLMVYRPSDYAFPPARGREGFEILQDGTFIDHPIGAGDARRAVQGTWQPQGSKRLEVSSAVRMPYTVEVVYCDDAVLKLRQVA